MGNAGNAGDVGIACVVDIADRAARAMINGREEGIATSESKVRLRMELRRRSRASRDVV